LDNEDGALARLVGRVERAHATILDEFSSDNDQSALARMFRVLERTNNNIATSLSLDEERSPLSRLRRELLNVFGEMEKRNQEFQDHMRSTVDSLRARREQAAKSTSHGFDFEDSVACLVQGEAQRFGDMFESTKDTAGAISRCKVGDFAVTLSPEAAAPGSRIVFEAKADKSYSIKTALDELKIARENRRAEVGVFVFSNATAPAGLEPLIRFGQDILAIWDADDPMTDVYLKAAVSLSRLIVVQQANAVAETSACVEEMEAAVSALIRDIATLEEITKTAQTVKNSGEKIIDKSDSLRRKVDRQLEILRNHVASMRKQEANL